MPATCYRCIEYGLDPPGEPFGACELCSCLACITCGVRVAGMELFRCVTCYSSDVLLTPGLGGAPAGADPDDPDGPDDPGPGGVGGPGGPGPGGSPIDSSAAFAVFQPRLYEQTRAEREYYHADIQHFLGMAIAYAQDAAEREQIDRRIGYAAAAGEAEARLRADLRAGAQRLARDVNHAEATGRLRPDLVADAFGVAQHAIAIPAGEPVPPDRLMALGDPRLRFVVGAAATATGPLVR